MDAGLWPNLTLYAYDGSYENAGHDCNRREIESAQKRNNSKINALWWVSTSRVENKVETKKEPMTRTGQERTRTVAARTVLSRVPNAPQGGLDGHCPPIAVCLAPVPSPARRGRSRVPVYLGPAQGEASSSDVGYGRPRVSQQTAVAVSESESVLPSANANAVGSVSAPHAPPRRPPPYPSRPCASPFSAASPPFAPPCASAAPPSLRPPRLYSQWRRGQGPL